MTVKIKSCPACGDSQSIKVASLNEASKAAYLNYSKAKGRPLSSSNRILFEMQLL